MLIAFTYYWYQKYLIINIVKSVDLFTFFKKVELQYDVYIY